MPRSRKWPCTVRCSDLAPGIQGRKRKLQMFLLHRGITQFITGSATVCSCVQAATFFPLICHLFVSNLHIFFKTTVFFLLVVLCFASVIRCIVDEVPVTAGCLPASLLQILETLAEVPWSRFENLQMEPAVSNRHADLWSPNTDPLCCSDLFITSPTKPAVPLP